ncbi:hypothetical protein HRbin36_00500 [bacterium HR36]|nr:hypothetical protein HRbin36_00500 [bacterium HR36]
MRMRTSWHSSKNAGMAWWIVLAVGLAMMGAIFADGPTAPGKPTPSPSQRKPAPKLAANANHTADGAANAPVDYLTQVKPILAEHCYVCHGLRTQKSGLRVDTVAFLRKGGSRGPAIVPGNSKGSLLVQALSSQSDDPPRMPFGKKPLTAEQIAVIAQWIDQGAKAPEQERPDDGRSHWAFRPPVRPPVPAVRNRAWLRNAIDAFILARLEAENIAPSPEADKITLARRVYLDLNGLPPSPVELEAFLHDSRPDAYERLVERLLASPHYGERWGRHWLDVARYADSHGYTIDGPREMWKYRDWVIEAFNRDMPYDQFLIE